MTKNYKAVLKSSLVMLVLFAVAGSGVAQAQQCIARAKRSHTRRAPRGLPRQWEASNCCAESPQGGFSFARSRRQPTISIDAEHRRSPIKLPRDRIIDSLTNAGASALTTTEPPRLGIRAKL